MMKVGTQAEQRRFRRYTLNLRCRVKPRKSRKAAVLPELHTETEDVSGGGLFFVASADWTIGTEIEVELYLPTQPGSGKPVAIRCRGKVARLVEKEEGRVGVGATIEHYSFFSPKEPKSN